MNCQYRGVKYDPKTLKRKKVNIAGHKGVYRGIKFVFDKFKKAIV